VSVIVVTDPSAVVPEHWRAQLPIRFVEIDIAWSDGTLERGDLPYATVAGRLAAAATPPTTGAPSPGTFQELFADALDVADGVLVVCPAKELSTTISSAILAAREFGEDKLRVLDARTAAAGQGLVVMEAAMRASEGASLDAVTERAREVSSHMNVWATLSQLGFLRRSGRVPALAAVGADALKLQPIVRYAGSAPSPVGVVRSGQRATERLLRAWDKTFVDGAVVRALAFHSDRKEEADHLAGRINERVSDERAEAVEVTASLASHTGPGLLGLAWFWDN
jgi:fatty acid kinase fatty acid binding subunit